GQPGHEQQSPVGRLHEVVALAAPALLPGRPRPAEMALEVRQAPELIERRGVASSEPFVERLDADALRDLDRGPAARRGHQHVGGESPPGQAGEGVPVEGGDPAQITVAQLREDEEDLHRPIRHSQSKNTRLHSALDARPDPYTSAPSTLSSRASGTWS